MKKIKVAVAHAAWAEGRKEGLDRLIAELRAQDVAPYVQVSEERQHARVWAVNLWRAVASWDCEAAVLLNDDVTVSPELVHAACAIAEVLPGEMVSLHCQLEVARSLADLGERWLRSYWLTGPGYMLTPDTARRLVEWVEAQHEEFLALYNEDGYANLFAFGMRRPIWQAIPALVQHDTSIASTLGYDKHPLRSAIVDWRDPLFKESDLSAVPFWLPRSPAPFVENPWMTTAKLRQLELGPEPRQTSGHTVLMFDPKKDEENAKAFEAMVPKEEPKAAAHTIALEIPTAARWKLDRKKSLARLLAALGLEGDSPGNPVRWRLMHDKARNEVWSETMWEWLCETGADWCMSLQDDVIPAPNFWACLEAMLASFPLSDGHGGELSPEVICLQSAHPAAPALAEDDVRWYATADGLVGVGYLLKRSVLREFLAWRESCLVRGWETAGRGGKTILPEDTLLGLFCMVTGRRVYSPVPTIIDHDTTIESVYGNDSHVNRRPLVRWDAVPDGLRLEWKPEDLEAPGFWQGRFKRIDLLAPDGTPIERSRRAYSQDPEPPRDLGRLHEVTPKLARNWVKGFGDRELARARADNGMHALRKMAYARRAKFSHASRHRILICTPTRGGISPHYHDGIQALVHMVGVDVTGALELLETWRWDEDVCRTRARMVAAFLETEGTVLHFRDSDIGCPVEAVSGMLHAIEQGHEFVACPYPRRDAIDFERVVQFAHKGLGLPVEAFAYQYPVGLPVGAKDVPTDDAHCSPLDWAPLGCSMLTRGMLERMVEHYRDEPQPFDALRSLSDEIGREEREDGLSSKLYALTEAYELGRSHGQRVLYVDKNKDDEREVVGLFNLIVREMPGTGKLRLWGEDQSFCFRWTDIGGKIAMYLGPGSPVDHHGTHLYKGYVEAFGKSRVAPEVRDALRARKEEAAEE